YMLNLTLILLALWLSLAWREAEHERGYLIALGVTFGVMTAHHRTALLLVPILLLWMLLARRDSWQQWLRRLLWVGLSGAPLLLFYAYLPLAVQMNRESGMARIYADASDPRMMLSMIQSREWWEVVQFPPTFGEAWQELTRLLALQGEQMHSPLLVALGAIGLLVGGYLSLPMTLLSLAFLYFGLSYNVYDIDTMLIPLTTMLLIGVALACQRGIDFVAQRQTVPRWVAPLLVVAIAAPLLVAAYRAGVEIRPRIDQSNDTVGMDFVELLTLMAEGDERMSVIAYQHAPLAIVQYTRARYNLPHLEPLYANRLEALPAEEVREELRSRWAAGRTIYFTREVVDLKLVTEIVEGLAAGRYRQAPTYFPDLFYLLPTDGLPPVTQRPTHPLTFEANSLALQGYDQRWIERRSGVYLELTLYWKATSSITQEHTLTLWPAGPLAGSLESVQLDGLMLGALPVTSLRAGEQVRDVYQLRLNLPPASYDGAAVGLTLQPKVEGEAGTVMIPVAP
ncbi:MAG: hypothetical protein H0T73_14680, partial [Ardenticatenales bacterium]|nr:hypothetical protein [Ardenticatenales bacterium]